MQSRSGLLPDIIITRIVFVRALRGNALLRQAMTA